MVRPEIGFNLHPGIAMPHWVGQPLRFLFLLFVAAVSLLFVVLLWHGWTSTRDQFASSTEALSRLHAQTTLDSLRAYEAELQVLGASLAGMRPEELEQRGRPLVERIKALNPGLAGFGLARPDGQLVLMTDFPPGTRLPNVMEIPEVRDSFLQALQRDHMVLGRTYFFRLFYEWVVPFRYAARDAQGRPRWVMISAFLLGAEAVPGASLALEPGQRIAMVRADGYYQSVMPADMEDWYALYSRPLAPEEMRHIRGAAESGGGVRFLDERMLAVRHLPDYDLYMLVEQDMRPVWRQFSRQAGLQLAGWVVLVLLGYGGYRLAGSAQQAVVEQRERHLARIRELAHRDALTGLPNRLALHQRLHELLEGGESVHVFACELFQLPRIREGYDSLADTLLRAVVGQLRHFLPREGELFRSEENRLVVVLKPDVELDAEHLQAFFQQAFWLGEQPMHCPAVVSRVCFPDEAASVELLGQATHLALAQARRDPRGRPGRFRPRMLEQAQRRLQIANRLQVALAEGDLRLVYQPQVALHQRVIVGFEVLARWHDVELGEVSPDEFVTVAEEIGLIHDLGRYVLRQALQEARSRPQVFADLRLAVNVCADELQRVSFWGELENLLRQENWPPDWLELEMTERILAEGSTGRLEQSWARKQALGVHLAIDDFGTGYSSLAYLVQIPARMMKIDRVFIDRMIDSEHYHTLVRSMVVMGQTLGLEVLAEGVETAEQLRRLQAMGCDQAQGYFIARPMPLDELEAWLEQQQHWQRYRPVSGG